mmetsp:Transcript_47922/g.104635  ORF Transcript_47922/g.104635 Transcript_47922/m.104635 type:complete len:503 (+) Transcript_47922:77-1585(+)
MPEEASLERGGERREQDEAMLCSPISSASSPGSSVSRCSSGRRDARVCRFCLCEEEDEADGDVDASTEDGRGFVHPCPCRGTNKYVHLSCLVQHFKAQGDWHNFSCPTCKHPYEGRALRHLAEISLARMIQDFGTGAPQVAHSLCYLAQAHAQLGNARESKTLLEQGLVISEAHFGQGHVVTAGTLAELASAHGKLGDVRRQKELLERSLEIKEQHFGAGHINTAITLNNLATAHSELGDVRKEKALLEHSLEIKERHYGRGHVQTTATLVNLAGVHSELGDVPKAQELLEWSLAIEERHFGVGHVETAITLNNLALACGECGDVQRMQELLVRSLDIKEQHFGMDHQELCLTLSNLGMACGALGQEVEARSFCNRALQICSEPGALSSRRHGVVLLRAASLHLALDVQPSAPIPNGNFPEGNAGSLSPVVLELSAQAAAVLREAVGPMAGARMMAVESRRMSRIWAAVGRTDVAEQLHILKDPPWIVVERADEEVASNCWL